MLLGRGRPFYRKLILGHGEPDTNQAALVGNSILLAQPTTGEIQATLPPPVEALGDNMVVIFTKSRDDVRKAKQLFVPREHYLKCARLRQEGGYAYTDVQVSETAAKQTLPENGVPEVIVREAHHMSEAQFFKPNLDGPASERLPEAKEPELVSADEDSQTHQGQDDETQDTMQEDTEEQKMNSFLQDMDSTSENLIGLDEAHTHDPLRQILSLQKQMELFPKQIYLRGSYGVEKGHGSPLVAVISPSLETIVFLHDW